MKTKFKGIINEAIDVLIESRVVSVVFTVVMMFFTALGWFKIIENPFSIIGLILNPMLIIAGVITAPTAIKYIKKKSLRTIVKEFFNSETRKNLCEEIKKDVLKDFLIALKAIGCTKRIFFLTMGAMFVICYVSPIATMIIAFISLIVGIKIVVKDLKNMFRNVFA